MLKQNSHRVKKNDFRKLPTPSCTVPQHPQWPVDLFVRKTILPEMFIGQNSQTMKMSKRTNTEQSENAQPYQNTSDGQNLLLLQKTSETTKRG